MSTTETSARRHNLPTTVFVVDDDSIVLRRLTKESLRGTNLGVLTAEDLPTAVRLFERFPVGAILADLNFRSETQDAERGLHDGLDFLSYVKDIQPTIPMYVMSMDVDDRMSRKQAAQKGLQITEWYDKLQSQPSQFSPWARIERDLILRALRSEEGFREEACEAGQDPGDLLTDETVADKVRSIFNYPRLTYLQYLPKGCGYQLKEPVEVQCWIEKDEFRARACRVPLLVDATGEDVVEALDNLGELMVSEIAAFTSESECKMRGYARFIKQQLAAYLERDETR